MVNALGALNLIELLLSAKPPPAASAIVVTAIFAWPSITADTNTLAPFGISPLHFLYVASTMLPFISYLPSTPSPNCISYLPSSAGTI